MESTYYLQPGNHTAYAVVVEITDVDYAISTADKVKYVHLCSKKIISVVFNVKTPFSCDA